MRNEFPEIDSIGSIGFCYGAWVGLFQANTSLFPGIKATAACHPSYQVEDNQGRSLVDLLEQVETPMFICPAGDDRDDYKEGGMVETTVEANGYDVEVLEFPDMNHGWVPRGDTTIPDVNRDTKLAIEGFMKFFEETL